jgi:hypothetical protein
MSAPPPPKVFEEIRIDERWPNYAARWNNLSRIGNTTIAKASILVPILGYLLLFQKDVIKFLQMHVDICATCEVSWRLHFFYFGCCFFALASLFYGWKCPTLIKRYEGAPNFFTDEKDYFASPRNFLYLYELVTKVKGTPPNDPHNLKQIAQNNRVLSRDVDYGYLAGVMGEHYVAQNMAMPIYRLMTYFLFWIGGILIAIPTVITMWEIGRQAASKIP